MIDNGQMIAQLVLMAVALLAGLLAGLWVGWESWGKNHASMRKRLHELQIDLKYERLFSEQAVTAAGEIAQQRDAAMAEARRILGA